LTVYLKRGSGLGNGAGGGGFWNVEEWSRGEVQKAKVEEQKERGLEAAHLLQKKFNSLMIHAWEGCWVQENNNHRIMFGHLKNSGRCSSPCTSPHDLYGHCRFLVAAAGKWGEEDEGGGNDSEGGRGKGKG
jgi:hypothetical protein